MANPFIVALAGGLRGVGDLGQAWMTRALDKQKREDVLARQKTEDDFRRQQETRLNRGLDLEAERNRALAEQNKLNYLLRQDAQDDLRRTRDNTAADSLLEGFQPHMQLPSPAIDFIRKTDRKGLLQDIVTPGTPSTQGQTLPGGLTLPNTAGLSSLPSLRTERRETPTELAAHAQAKGMRGMTGLSPEMMQKVQMMADLIEASHKPEDPSSVMAQAKEPTANPSTADENLDAYAQSIGKPGRAALTFDERVKALGIIGKADNTTPMMGPGGVLSGPSETALINRLSSQWINATKPIRDMERQVDIMDAGLNAARQGNTAAGAQAVLVTFQKILDPTSVVRESEYARSASGLALMDRIRGSVERLTQGGAGVPVPELEQFANLARTMVKSSSSSYLTGTKTRLQKTADRYRIPHEVIFEADSPYGNGTTQTPAVPEITLPPR